jgi:hypothetical protein
MLDAVGRPRHEQIQLLMALVEKVYATSPAIAINDIPLADVVSTLLELFRRSNGMAINSHSPSSWR